MSNNDLSKNFEIWTSTFMDIFGKYAPMKSKRVKHETQQEWINDEIKMAIKNRDAYHKRKDWKQYKFWCNKNTALIRTSNKNFFTRSVSGNKDTSFLWKHVRNISGTNNDRQIPKEINAEYERIYEGDEVIKKLDLFFSKISEKLVSKLPQQDLPFYFDKLTSYLNAKVPDNIKFTIPLMKNTDLISIIGSLDATKATGLDGITPKILKKSADIVNPSLF